MTYSVDFRKKVLAIKDKEKQSFDAVAKRFGIAGAAIFRWSKNIEPQKTRDRKPTKIDMEALRKDIELYPDSYCYERALRLGASPTGIRDAKKRLRVTYKKTLKHPKANQEKRSTFCQKIQELKNEGRVVAYIDESGFAHDMSKTHGYSDRGKRCYGTHDWGARGRTNAIGALIGKALLTVMLLSGTVNTQVFTSWLKEDLLPKLPPESVIVMDNATFHKGEEMKLSITKAGHTLLYLPPHSPDLNPIEHKWAESKHTRRKLGCSVDDLFQYHMS